MDIVLDPDGIRKVLTEPSAVEALRERASATVEDAKRSGPRNPRHHRHVVDQLAVGASRVTRDGAEVDIDWNDWRWRFLEFGTQQYPPYRLVTRGAQNAGLVVKDARTT